MSQAVGPGETASEAEGAQCRGPGVGAWLWPGWWLVWQQNERQSRRKALAGGALGRLCSDLGFKS